LTDYIEKLRKGVAGRQAASERMDGTGKVLLLKFSSIRELLI
jgi:hypothetical protein